MKLVEYFLYCVLFFTRIPVGRFVGTSHETLIASRIMLPVVGLLIGGIAAVSFLVLSLFLPKMLVVLLVVLLLILITGAFHEDALADSVDGFGGGVSKSDIIRIMKDSRNGTYGTLALILGVLLVFVSLMEITIARIPIVLLFVEMTSRFGALPLMWKLPYVRHDGRFEKLFAENKKSISGNRLLGAGIFTLLVSYLLLGEKGILLFLSSFVIIFITGAYYKKRLGGVTGDCFGATIKLIQIAMLTGAVALQL